MSTKLPIYQIDAFTNTVFGGNPAAVCPLDSWLPDETLQNIAAENNLSETAFFVPEDDNFHIRWFTPLAEVELCGHATLATAFVIFEFIAPDLEKITFNSLSGPLIAHKTSEGIMMDFPIWSYEKIDVPDSLADALGERPSAFYKAPDCMAVFDDPDIVRNLSPNQYELSQFKDARGILVTAPGDDGLDFISRAFFPRLGVPEDPVTGSAHCVLTPYWANKLGKTKLKARQVSKRSGDLACELKGDRVEITGQAVLYMQGTIHV